jgi:hypothetical protein
MQLSYFVHGGERCPLRKLESKASIDPESLKVLLQMMKPESQHVLLGAVGAKTSLQSGYVGLTLVFVGAFLEVIGYVAARPWKERASS